MTIYLSSTPSLRRKSRKKGVQRFEKLDKENFQSGNKIPSYEPPRDDHRDIPSMPMNVTPESTEKRSIMESVLHGDESQEVKDEVIRKSKCLAPAYNKGAFQYVGSEDAAKDVGKK